MRPVTKMITVVCAGLLGLTAAGCAKPGSAGEADGMTALSEQAQTDGLKLYTDLATVIFGSGQDRWNAGRVQAHKMQTNIADCMAKEGFEYTITEYSTSGAGQYTPSDGFDEFTEIRADFGIAFAAEETARLSAGYSGPGVAKLDADGQAAWAEAMSGPCSAVDPPGLENSHLPASLIDLAEPFAAVLTPVHDDPVVAKMRADYAGCVAERGYDAASWSELRDATQALFPAVTASGPAPIDVNSDGWAATVQAEKDAAAADTACRSDMTAYAAGLAYPVLLDWESSHADQLATITAEWDAMRTEAEALLK